ncbi:MAG: pyruvate carboxylase, partial [archaeon]|nr:pyruvate carboxylase [archaeon]
MRHGPVWTASLPDPNALAKPLKKILVANRGEIALRVLRACNELGIRSVAVYAHEDRASIHRIKADESYLLGNSTLGPIGSYLSIDELLGVARASGVDGIHPGYGFLSESAEFARRCQQHGIKFIGPSAAVIESIGNKTAGRELAIAAGVPVIPGSGALGSVEEALQFAAAAKYPIILKAASGGGGRGMRVVHAPEQLPQAFERCRSEALAFFGDATVFAEKYLVRPRHIEVQVLADSQGSIVHLHERDCSVQRRYQKVVESAPAVSLDDGVRQGILRDAVLLAAHARYENAGTFEFLVTGDGYYFCEANPRVQVEHTVTEEITGIDIVQSQIRIAEGYSLADIGLASQEVVQPRGYAIQVRITTEDPKLNFSPSTGTISVYRSPGGTGIRLDGANSYAGAVVTPHYDSLLVKCIAHSLTWESTLHKTARALREFRIRGVQTNIPFLLQVINHPHFASGVVDTGFIDDHPELMDGQPGKDRGNKLLAYLADVAVNGPQIAGMAKGVKPSTYQEPVLPPLPSGGAQQGVAASLRAVFQKEGPAAFAKAVRARPSLMVMDTTWRDAHQSLLATRMRTRDMLRVAPYTRHALRNVYALECWGGATFDVALRFLHECPWDRLEQFREAIPDIPFQMLLRGANGLAYSSNPDNVLFRFARQCVRSGMDVFRVFDSLNYIDNLRIGMDAVGEAGGIIEAAISYTGDVATAGPGDKYSLDYYLRLAQQVVDAGAHVLAIKDMAGLLTAESARTLISAMRERHPDVPIHVHTHDSAGLGIASMLAAARAGADVVDAAVDSLSGMTSQPSIGALIASHHQDIGVSLEELI